VLIEEKKSSKKLSNKVEERLKNESKKKVDPAGLAAKQEQADKNRMASRQSLTKKAGSAVDKAKKVAAKQKEVEKKQTEAEKSAKDDKQKKAKEVREKQLADKKKSGTEKKQKN